MDLEPEAGHAAVPSLGRSPDPRHIALALPYSPRLSPTLALALTLRLALAPALAQAGLGSASRAVVDAARALLARH